MNAKYRGAGTLAKGMGVLFLSHHPMSLWCGSVGKLYIRWGTRRAVYTVMLTR